MQPGLDEPIFALATPLAPSALAVVRLTGAGCLGLLATVLQGHPDLACKPGRTIHRAVVIDGAEPLDEVLVAVYRSPRSYTGEEGAEITCHGSLPVIRRILELLGATGMRPAGPGEFTRRAFLNGKMDLTRAEAVNEIVRARTDRARALALERLAGAVERRVREARDLLLGLQAAIEAELDYPEEDHGAEVDPALVDRAERLLAGLVRTWRRGRLYQEGIAAAIAGATNAGKSSLFNLLLRQERAIVSEVHGTTRDWLEGSIDLEGIPVRLFDTAGLRPSDDPLEQEGMRRAEAVARSADLVLYLVDAAVGLSDDDRSALARLADSEGTPVLLRLWNKVDLPEARLCPEGFLPISAAEGTGLEALERAMAEAALAGTAGAEGEPLIDSDRQRRLLERSLASLARLREERARGVPLDLLAVELREALDCLGEVTGEVTTAEVLDRLFSSFCVGK